MNTATVPVVGFASMSADHLYRYSLTRQWATSAPATFVMLNPSTANGEDDDATIRRCMGFARAWRCGGLHVVNLFAYRATKPAHMFLADDPIGPDNDAWITTAALGAAKASAPLIVAWGALAPRSRVEHVLALPAMERAQCLGTTANGAPRHPLYLKVGLEPKPWSMPAAKAAA